MTEKVLEKAKKIVSIRKELETDVTSINKPLREAVKTMDWIELLRNCHPIYRKDYARKLAKLGQLTEREAMEFN